MTTREPALPSPIEAHASHRRGARNAAGIVMLLAFGFVANSLLSTPQAEAPPLRAYAPSAATVAAAPAVANTSELPEVDAAVRNWVWEGPGPEQRPGTRQDLEELWLAR